MNPKHLLFLLWLFFSTVSQASEVRVVILATTDLHGYLLPWDYLSGKPAERGLAKIATLIRQERKANPNTLLIDCGDTIQGSPLESVYQNWVRTGKLPLGMKPDRPLKGDPMMLAMNALDYDAMAVGNHEFNFGLKNLQHARETATFPWISANIETDPASGRKPFLPYIVKIVGGVKVGIVGLTTAAVPSWEKPENVRIYKFLPGKDAVARAVADLRQKHRPDIVVLTAHAGLERDIRTGELRTGEDGRENMVHEIATQVKGIDAIVFGHTHQQLPALRLGDVLLTQAKNWGMSLARVEFVLEGTPARGWRVLDKSSRLLPVTEQVPVDEKIAAIAEPYHEITEQYLNTPVAKSARRLDAGESRIEDTAIIDAIQRPQLHYAKADVSFTAAFNPRAWLPAGPVTVRQIASLYVYDNELYAIEGNGKMIRDALENAAKFYRTCTDPSCERGPLINKNVLGFNYDMAQGIEYEIDLRRQLGGRILNLRWKGAPLADSQKLRIAVNNYRAGGSGGYTMFKGAPVVWRSYEDIRELIIRYYSRHPLPQQPDNNWRIVPEAAHRTLEAEILAEYGRPLDK